MKLSECNNLTQPQLLSKFSCKSQGNQVVSRPFHSWIFKIQKLEIPSKPLLNRAFRNQEKRFFANQAVLSSKIEDFRIRIPQSAFLKTRNSKLDVSISNVRIAMFESISLHIQKLGFVGGTSFPSRGTQGAFFDFRSAGS